MAGDKEGRHISRVSIRNVLSIEQLDMDVGHGVIARGRTGIGKTALLDAMAAAFGKNNRVEMVSKGQESGQVLLVMDDGAEIRRTLARNGKDRVQVKQPDGSRVRSPQAFLNGIAPALSFNPVQFIQESDRRQAKILADVFPVRLGIEDLHRVTGDLIPLEGIDFERNGLEVANDVYRLAYQLRTEANADVRATEASLEAERSRIPEGFEPDAVRGVSSKDLANELAAIRQHNRVVQDTRNRFDELAGQRQGVEQKIDALRRQIAELEGQLVQLNERLTKGREWLDANQPRPTTDLEKRLTELDQQREYLAAHDRAVQHQKARQSQGARAKRLDMVTRALADLPAELVRRANIPITGLALEDGRVVVNGLPFANLSEGQKLEIAVQVAAAGAGDLKLLCIDGVERLSSDVRQRLIDRLMGQGFQLFMTEVDDGDLSLEDVRGNPLRGTEEAASSAGVQEADSTKRKTAMDLSGGAKSDWLPQAPSGAGEVSLGDLYPEPSPGHLQADARERPVSSGSGTTADTGFTLEL